MIRSFRHAGLKALFETGSSSKVRADLQKRVLRRLDVIDHAVALAELDLPGFSFHRLRGKPTRYSVHVNGPWCVTFEWDGEDAVRVDLEHYH